MDTYHADFRGDEMLAVHRVDLATRLAASRAAAAGHVCVRVCERARESERVSVFTRERKGVGGREEEGEPSSRPAVPPPISLPSLMCLCVRERGMEGERRREKERERESANPKPQATDPRP